MEHSASQIFFVISGASQNKYTTQIFASRVLSLAHNFISSITHPNTHPPLACTAFTATIFTFQLLQHFVSKLFHTSLHNYTTQISNLFPLLLQKQFHVGQTNQWQEKEEIDKLFFFPELLLLLLIHQVECGQDYYRGTSVVCNTTPELSYS